MVHDAVGCRTLLGGAPYSLIESAKLCRVEPRAYLREAALRAVRNPGTVTLAARTQVVGILREIGD